MVENQEVNSPEKQKWYDKLTVTFIAISNKLFAQDPKLSLATFLGHIQAHTNASLDELIFASIENEI